MSQSSSYKISATPQPAREQNIQSDRPCNIGSGICSVDFSNKSTEEIITIYYNTDIFKQSKGKPHVVSRDLVWHLFTVAELYGNRFNTLKPATIEAIHNSVMKVTQCDESTWRRKCIPFINSGIRHFFRIHNKNGLLFKNRCHPSV